jgi:hypothetical protein
MPSPAAPGVVADSCGCRGAILWYDARCAIRRSVLKSIIASIIVGGSVIGATYHACVTAKEIADTNIRMRQCEAYLRLLSEDHSAESVALLAGGFATERADNPVSKISSAMASLAGVSPAHGDLCQRYVFEPTAKPSP